MSSKFTIFFRLCNRAFLPCRHPTGNLRRPSLAPYRSPSRTSAGTPKIHRRHTAGICTPQPLPSGPVARYPRFFRAIPLPTSPILPDDAGTAPTHPHDRPRRASPAAIGNGSFHRATARHRNGDSILRRSGCLATLPLAPLHKRTTAATAPHPDIFRASALPGASRRKPTL